MLGKQRSFPWTPARQPSRTRSSILFLREAFISGEYSHDPLTAEVDRPLAYLPISMVIAILAAIVASQAMITSTFQLLSQVRIAQTQLGDAFSNLELADASLLFSPYQGRPHQ